MVRDANEKVVGISREEADKIGALLAEKAKEPVPEPNVIPVKRLVGKWYPTLHEMRNKGYTLDMLVGVLGEFGVRIDKARLSQYMAIAAKTQPAGSGGGTSNASSVPGVRPADAAVNTTTRRNGSFDMRPDRKL